MKSSRNGTNTYRVSVAGVNARGFWLRLGARRLFVAYQEFPWFREFTALELSRVRRPAAHHLRWAEFDIDLEVDAIRRPGRYPLIERRLRGDPRQVVRRLRAAKKRTARAS